MHFSEIHTPQLFPIFYITQEFSQFKGPPPHSQNAEKEYWKCVFQNWNVSLQFAKMLPGQLQLLRLQRIIQKAAFVVSDGFAVSSQFYGQKWQWKLEFVHVNICDKMSPVKRIVCLRAFRHDKFQLRMPSHLEGPGIWLSVWRFLLTHCLYERAAKVLARLRGCAGSPEPSLLAKAISTKFAWRGPNDAEMRRQVGNILQTHHRMLGNHFATNRQLVTDEAPIDHRLNADQSQTGRC